VIGSRYIWLRVQIMKFVMQFSPSSWGRR
jgi:hypothetical protein